jgi:organic radical activating enzyme
MHICKIPWISLSNDPEGSVRPCCIYKDSIKKPDGTEYFLQKDTIEEIYNSEYMNNLRDRFLNGEKPNECETCWIDETNGYKSKRQMYDDLFNKIDVTKDNTPVKYPIDFQLIISNACNLKCRSCGPSHSTQWQKEMNNLPDNNPGTNDYKGKFFMPHGQSGGNGSVLIDDIESWASKLKRLEIVGGEPFYVEKWTTILTYLIENGYSKNVDLAMSTNATIFNHDLLINMCDNFKTVGIGLSVDGMGDVFNLLRKNANWKLVEEICLKYYNIHQQRKVSSVNFNYTYTVSWLDAYMLPDFYEWVKNNTPELKIWNNILHQPAHMKITMLPDNEKQRIQDRWESYDWGEYKADINSILTFMWSESYTDEEIKKEYKNFIYFDYVRKENTYEVIKEYHPLLEKFFK